MTSGSLKRSRKLISDCFCSIWQVHWASSNNETMEKMLRAFSCQYLINVQSQKPARKLFSTIVCCFLHWIPNNWFYNSHFFPLFIRIDECVRGFSILHTQCRWMMILLNWQLFSVETGRLSSLWLRDMTLGLIPKFNQMNPKEKAVDPENDLLCSIALMHWLHASVSNQRWRKVINLEPYLMVI